jgi:mannose/cellobiose epimerase-like protein (N-acyl-D-glucosamine 2-epimerase family)
VNLRDNVNLANSQQYDNSLIEQRIQEGCNFIIDHLWDNNYGGFFKTCESNGSYPVTLKYASFQAFSALAFYNLYLNLHDQVYWDLADSAINFLVDHLWDALYGGFFHCSDRKGNVSNVDYSKLPSIKDAGYQAWCAFALFKSFDLTKRNEILILANKTLNFLIEKLWNKTYFIFSKLSEADGSNPEDITISYYDFWIISALIKGYHFFSNDLFLGYALATINYLFKYLWNSINQCFYYSSFLNGTLIDKSTYLVVQTSALLALNDLYLLTGNETYYQYIQNISNSLIYHLWDPLNNGFFDIAYSDGTNSSKNPSIQATQIYSFTLSELSNNTERFTSNYTIANLNFIIEKMWDSTYGGYFYAYSQDGTPISFEKWVIDQVWVLYALSLLVSGRFDANLIILFIVIAVVCVSGWLLYKFHKKFSLKILIASFFSELKKHL